ncbi:hypothetical protein [Rhodoferax sp.]|uniref:hypothetical protein n=1 Tax=Rhodoferax sp. TaxID=50421 RepID=UPI002616DC5D|nr:hypothetical protein [Rhodoferax sp.]MDD2918647.1 hypothetical protein [Rhodoferax sp.]
MNDISRTSDMPSASRSCDAKGKLFKKGDFVSILPAFQDAGDDQFTWVVMADEEKGRVDICPVNSSLTIKPVYTLQTGQITLRPANT